MSLNLVVGGKFDHADGQVWSTAMFNECTDRRSMSCMHGKSSHYVNNEVYACRQRRLGVWNHPSHGIAAGNMSRLKNT